MTAQKHKINYLGVNLIKKKCLAELPKEFGEENRGLFY
jgi:hypothetical protein